VAFWSPRRVDFCSRIVEARSPDGSLLRAKVTIVFHQACTAREAEAAAERYGDMVIEGLANQARGSLPEERALSVHLMARPDVKRHLRRLDVTGLHVVGSGIRPVATGRADETPVAGTSKRR